MFGYIRISKSELDEENYKRFKAYYCGLCRAIGRYSALARLGLSYDMTFLAILLAAVYDEQEEITKIRCGLHPFKREEAVACGTVMDYAAQMSILLVYKKFEDDMRDEKSLKAFFGRLIYSRPMKKIKYTRSAEKITECLKKLSELEKNNCCEPDETADCFARICEIIFTPDFITDEKTGQILSWMGYNIGRWIYLLDAFDDLKDDIKHNSYNPFKDRYKDEKLAENTESTLTYNLANIAAAYDLLDVKRNDKIIRNILYSGMGGVQNEILKLREENNESLRGSRCKSE